MEGTKKFTKTDLETMEQRYRAVFINSLGGFKSLAMIGTIDTEGKTNISIVNSIFHIGANPPLIGMISRPDGTDRHTLHNIRATQWYTINHVHEDIYKQAHQTSASYAREISEFDACGFTPLYSEVCPAPYIAESRVRIGLQVADIIPLSINGTILIIGAVQEVILPESCLYDDGFLDLERAGTLAGAGLDSYHTTHRIARLSYAKPDVEIKEITISRS